MRGLSFSACAPSNIALIKYMGKTDFSRNIPANSSISLTLDGLSTWVEATGASHGQVSWVPELPRVSELTNSGRAFELPRLDEAATQRAVRHVERVRAGAREIFARFGLAFDDQAARGGMELRSANSFPAASGIASSASAFAAITVAAAHFCARDSDAFVHALESPDFRRALAGISREGSGSSCRSFEGPFVFWENEDARALETEMPDLAHFVLLISSEQKSTSSSAAHSKIKSSPLWEARCERLKERTSRMIGALRTGRVDEVAQLAWREAWEMHSLFHTAEPPFSYWQPGTVEVLQWLAPLFSSVAAQELPIVTLDAGPNVHLIVPLAAREQWRTRINERFAGLKVLEDVPGKGVRAAVLR